MKITQDHYNELEEKFNHVLAGNLSPRFSHHPVPVLSECLSDGMSAKRWRWDILYMGGLSNWIGETLYPYLTDDNIDSALRKITGTK